MNSILQCLCKTKLLRELFLSNSRDDLLKGKLAKGNLFQNSFFATKKKTIKFRYKGFRYFSHDETN